MVVDANRFCYLDPEERIKNNFTNITKGFRSVQDEIDHKRFDVANYGVDVTSSRWGADPTGVADSGAKINAAIEYAFNNGIHAIFIPSGTYNLETSIKPMNDSYIRGAGRTTVLRIKDNTGIPAIHSPAPVYNVIISHLTVDGNKQHNYDYWDECHGLNLHMSSSTIEYLRFKNIRNTALKINDDSRISDILGYLNKIRHNDVEDSWVGVSWGWRCTDSWCDYNNIGSDHANIIIQGGSCRFTCNHLDGFPEYNVILEGGNTLSFIENIIENANKHGFYAPSLSYDEATYNLLIANNIIRVSSREASNTYDLVHLAGRDTKKSDGIVISGNQLVSSSSSPRHAVYLENVENAVVTGNCFLGGYTAIPVKGVNVMNLQVNSNIPSN